MWRTHSGEREPLWCTALVFACVDGNFFLPTILVHHITHYTQYIHYNIPSYWVIHYPPLVYVYPEGCLNPMDHVSYICFFSTLNPQVFFYGGHVSHFDDRTFSILQSHGIQSFILKIGYDVHGHPKYNDPNFNINNSYCNAILNWIRDNGTLEFALAHMNAILVETWEYFKNLSQQSPRNISIIHTYSPFT